MLVATVVFAAILCVTLGAVIVAVGAGKIGREAIVITRNFRARFGCAWGAEIRENRLLLNLALAQGSEIVGDGFLFVESDLAGVGADETLVEDAAGKLVKVFVLEGAQHARADFGSAGDGVERDAALLALFAKFLSKGSHDGSGGRSSGSAARE